MRRHKVRIAAVLTALFVVGTGISSYGASGSWGLTEDGKNWGYWYSPDDQVKDEWIEYEGKEYYLDSKGNMKTGWVTDKGDGSRYYMGEDGAKCFNMFTPDDKYVGPDGTALTAFDEYRGTLKKQLLSSRSKSAGKKNAENGELLGFILTDLNGDEYKDIAVFNRAVNPDKVLLTAIWNPQDGKLDIASEEDPDSERTSFLSRDPQSNSYWLIIEDKAAERTDYFVMEDETPWFEHRWSFSFETDDWGDRIGCINGDAADSRELEEAVNRARSEAGTPICQEILPLEEEYIRQAVDQAPSEEKLYMWES